MDGNFYVDSRGPWLIAAPPGSPITIASTDTAVVPLTNVPVTGSNYWWAGKLVRIRMFGQMTPAGTPGTLTVDVLYGTGASNNGTILASSAALTLITGTNLSYEIELYIRCRAIGTSGSLICTGRLLCNTALIAAGMGMIPVSAPAAVSVDTTAASVISPQLKNSVGTATTTVVEYSYEAMN